MANEERVAQWEERIGQWRDSGLSQRAFALQHGFPARQFSYWVRRLSAPAPSATLLPLTVQRVTTIAPAVSLRSPSGWSVMLPPELPTSWIAELLRSLA